MRSVPWTLLGVVSVVVFGSGIAWTSLAGGAAPEAGQTQAVSAAALHKEAIVVDGHVHIMTPVFHQGIDPWKVQPTGLFDYARAKQGGLDVVIHTVYTQDAYNNYNYGVKQALRLISRFYEILDANQDKMELALTSADVRRIVASGKMAAILALEGMPDMEGDLDVVRIFYRLGVRMIQLTNHSTTNALTDAAGDEPKWGGISDRGRAMIREMNRLGIIIDPSHTTEAAHFQVIAASQAPVANSHTMLRRFSGQADVENRIWVSDELLKALAAKGGLLALIRSAVDLGVFGVEGGVTNAQRWAAWERAHPPARRGPDESGTFISGGRRATLVLPNKGIRPPDKDYGAYLAALDAERHDNWTGDPTAGPGRGTGYGTPWREQQQKLIDAGVPLPTVEDWVEQVVYMINLVGDDHVGLGLDLMGRPAMRDFDATQYGRLTEAMLRKGLSPGTIKKVLGENWLRLLDQAKVPGLQPPARTMR